MNGQTLKKLVSEAETCHQQHGLAQFNSRTMQESRSTYEEAILSKIASTSENVCVHSQHRTVENLGVYVSGFYQVNDIISIVILDNSVQRSQKL